MSLNGTRGRGEETGAQTTRSRLSVTGVGPKLMVAGVVADHSFPTGEHFRELVIVKVNQSDYR